MSNTASSPSPASPRGERANVTQLLIRAGGGDVRAAEELLPLVYEELRVLARANMARERGGGAGQTLEPTALVHEAYMRLVGSDDVQWNGRGHFFGAAAQAMRRILVDRARARNRVKRGGGQARVELADDALAIEPQDDQVIDLDKVLADLEKLDARKAEIVMLRYFAGLTIEQTAAALGLAPTTVKTEWAFARAWLNRELTRLGQVEGEAV